MAGITVTYTRSPESVERVTGINQEIKETAEISQLQTTAPINLGVVTMLAYRSENFMAT